MNNFGFQILFRKMFHDFQKIFDKISNPQNKNT